MSRSFMTLHIQGHDQVIWPRALSSHDQVLCDVTFMAMTISLGHYNYGHDQRKKVRIKAMTALIEAL
jgi:hypothetical protein